MHSNRKLSEDNKGFTLVELIITVVILALVTAPFLHSFVTASNTNLKSKRIQEANELSQYIIEDFKASSIELLKQNYKLSQNPSNPSIFVGGLSKETSTGALPAGFNENYSAKIELKPSTVVTKDEDAIPVIANLNREECAVFVNNLTKYDSIYEPNINSREVNVTIDGYNGKYTVTLEIGLYDILHSKLGSATSTWEYSVIPSVYILYKAKSTNDKITINNYLTDAMLNYDINTGMKDKVNIYLIKQKKDDSSYYPAPPSTNIKINEQPAGSGGNSFTLAGLVSPHTSDKLESTIICTNMVTEKTDDNTVNGPVEMKKIDTVYNLNIEIAWNGKKITSYSASKTTNGD